jgi:hypothetical protein
MGNLSLNGNVTEEELIEIMKNNNEDGFITTKIKPVTYINALLLAMKEKKHDIVLRIILKVPEIDPYYDIGWNTHLCDRLVGYIKYNINDSETKKKMFILCLQKKLLPRDILSDVAEYGDIDYIEEALKYEINDDKQINRACYDALKNSHHVIANRIIQDPRCSIKDYQSVENAIKYDNLYIVQYCKDYVVESHLAYAIIMHRYKIVRYLLEEFKDKFKFDRVKLYYNYCDLEMKDILKDYVD